MKFRPAAVPLITIDPFISVWSESDTLNSGITKHWTGKSAPFVAGIYANGTFFHLSCANADNCPEYHRMHQKNFAITPLNTVYEFENHLAKVTLRFITPLLPNRLDILTRPVSYVEYTIDKKCDDDTEIDFIFGVCANWCADGNCEIEFQKNKFSVSCGKIDQKPLCQSGDCVTIDWGYLHLCDADAYVTQYPCKADPDDADEAFSHRYNLSTEKPYIVVKKKESSGVITLAYDEIHAIEYFGEKLDECWKEEFDSFDSMINAAKNEYSKIRELCIRFDDEMIADALEYGENYIKIISLAYRQAVAAHKTVKDKDGNILFLSKECASNGCIGTLDVTYPSIPLFLKYNPELVKGMLRPIIKFADSDAWKFDFAPHDVGQYPIANGQVYGSDDIASQMPVEESGNLLLCLAAVEKYSGGDRELFEKNRELADKCVRFLTEFGYDPGSQLCTDDFAGHLDHNCNLSLKAILGIASYSKLSGDMSYMDTARDFARKWEKEASACHGGTRLTFDNPDGWSMKYNMVWDNLLGFNLFSDEVKKKEIEIYNSKMCEYGVPLDSREDYTKIDWLMWSTCIYDDRKYFQRVCDSIVKMINETPDRIPLTDWYDTKTAIAYPFRNRTVVGGLFIKLL